MNLGAAARPRRVQANISLQRTRGERRNIVMFNINSLFHIIWVELHETYCYL